MKNIRIDEPCNENWSQMSPTEKGAFCQKCATQVIDFTKSSKDEIKFYFKSLAGKSVCTRISSSQMEELNAEFELWQARKNYKFQSALTFTLIVVFGLSLFSCTQEEERITIQKIQETAAKVLNEKSFEDLEIASPDSILTEDSKEPFIMGKVAYEHPEIMNETYISEIQVINEEIPPKHEYVTMGDIAFLPAYTEYLEATLRETKQEYDNNGILIPHSPQVKIYPNPVVTMAKLEIGLPESMNAEISLFDLAGNFIQSIHKGSLSRGTTSFQIEMSNLPPGNYFATFISNDFMESVKIVKI